MAENRLSSEPFQDRVITVTNASALVWSWHKFKCNLAKNSQAYFCIGIVKDNYLIGSVVYHRFRWPDVEMGIFTTDQSWCTRRVLRDIFSFAFKTMNCRRVTATADPANKAVLDFIERLGFAREGCLKNALPTGDMLILGMQKDECRWIK